jgi:hypothetical protein
MADEDKSGVPAAPNASGSAQPSDQAVEIDLSPLVGKGGGELSSRSEVPATNIEER